MDIANMRSLDFMQKPVAKPAPAANPFFAGQAARAVSTSATAPAIAQMDQCQLFQAQLNNGQVKFNPNQPALPHFASKSWIA